MEITLEDGRDFEHSYYFELKYDLEYDYLHMFDGVDIKNAEVAQVEVKYYDNALHIKNAENSGEYFVYSVEGKLVQSGKINAGDNEIGINLRTGAYVAKVQISGKKPQSIKFTVAR
jgi:hypothetical protein